MALTDWDFDGADWNNPDPGDGRYIECLCEALREKCSHLPSLTDEAAIVNGFFPYSDNKCQAFTRERLTDFDSVLFAIIPHYYDHTDITVYGAQDDEWNGIYWHLENAVYYKPEESNIISCSIRGTGIEDIDINDTGNNHVQWSPYWMTFSTPWSIDSISKAAGIGSTDLLMACQSPTTSYSYIKSWITSRYEIIKLLRVYKNVSVYVCLKIWLTEKTVWERAAGGIDDDAYQTATTTLIKPAPDVEIDNAAYEDGYALDILGNTHTGATAVRDAIDVVNETENAVGRLGISSATSIPYEWWSYLSSYTNAEYSEPDCVTMSYGSTDVSFGFLYGSYHHWAMNIELTASMSIGHVCGADDPPNEYHKVDTPITIVANDDVSFDENGEIVMGKREITTVDPFTDVEIDFGIDGDPPIPPTDVILTPESCVNYYDDMEPPNFLYSYYSSNKRVTDKYKFGWEENVNWVGKGGWNVKLEFDIMLGGWMDDKDIGTTKWI